MNTHVQTTTKQPASAAQITALANHILHRKGQVDFTGTNLTVTPPTDMDADDAGIIVKCASENGGTVKISGATEFTDDAWEIVLEPPLWMITVSKTYGIPLVNLAKAYGIDADIKKSFDGTGRWLVGDGTAYIQTDITLDKQTDSLYAKYIVTGSSTYFVVGTATDSDTPGMHIGVYYWRAGYEFQNSDPIAVCVDHSFAPTNKVLESFVSVNHRYHKTDGVITVENNGTYTGTGTTGNLSIGANGSTFTGKWDRVITERNGAPSHFFIPMLKDSVPGMYDLIGQQFYANANTSGAFTIE